MAQYYAVLKKAIGALQPSSSDARRGIYEKARSALVGQLKAIQPPLSTSEISRQRLELEEAIRKVEREALAVVPIQVVPQASQPVSYEEVEEPMAPPPAEEPEIEDAKPVRPIYAEERDDFAVEARPYEPDLVEDEEIDPPPVVPMNSSEPPAAVLRQAFGFDERKPSQAAAAAPTIRVSPMVREARPAQPGPAQSGTPQSAAGWRPLTVEDDAEPEVEEALVAAPAVEPVQEDKSRRRRSVLEDPEEGEVGGHRRRSRAPALILGTILVLAVGLIGYLWQQGLLTDATAAVSSLFSRGGAPEGDVAALDPSKAEDRIVPEGGLAPPPATPAPNVRVIDTRQGGNVPAPPQAPGQAQAPAPTNPPTSIGDLAALNPPVASPTVPATPAPTVVVAPVAQQAMLFEQPATEGAQPIVTEGTVTWSYSDDGPDGAAVVAAVSFPSKSIGFRFLIRKNQDPAIPASHLFDVVPEGTANLPGGRLDTVLPPVMKDAPQAVGTQLRGASIRVTDSLYWIALSNNQADQNSNLELLGGQQWMDVPLVYGDGKRAIMTLELGPAGEGLFDQAILAWAQ
jgi:hypothetical protein